MTGDIAGIIKVLSEESIKTYHENLLLMAVAMHLDNETDHRNIVYRISKTKKGNEKGKFLGVICRAGYVLVPRCEIKLFKALRMWPLCSHSMNPDCVVFFCPIAHKLFATDSLILNQKAAYKLLSQTKQTGIPLLYIEEESSTLIQTAHSCALRVVEQQRLLRVLDIQTDELFGFAFPKQQEPENVTMFNIKDLIEGDENPTKDQEVDEDSKYQEDGDNVDSEDQEDESDENSNDQSENELNTSFTTQPAKKRRLNPPATAPIKVCVKWVTSNMRFAIRYEVVKEDVWNTVTEVVNKARDMLIMRNLSSSYPKLDSFFIKLTEQELNDIKPMLACSNTRMPVKWSWLKNKQDLEIKQLPSAPSFVFQVKSHPLKQSCIVKFFVDTLACYHFRSANDIIESLKDEEKVYFCTLAHIIPFKTSSFCIFDELLPPLLTDDAKCCIVDLSTQVRTALQIMHLYGIAHLDVRLPNICYRKNCNNIYIPVLIDYERVRECESFSDGCYVESDLYPTGLMNRYIDYVQLFRMAFAAVSNPPKREHLAFVDSFVNEAKSSITAEDFLDKQFTEFIQKLKQEKGTTAEVTAVVEKRNSTAVQTELL